MKIRSLILDTMTIWFWQQQQQPLEYQIYTFLMMIYKNIIRKRRFYTVLQRMKLSNQLLALKSGVNNYV